MTKVALVMLKAMVVFEIGRSESHSTWVLVVTALFGSSFLVMALMTLALSMRKVWQRPHLLAEAGVQQPRAFGGQRAVAPAGLEFVVVGE